MNILKRTIKKTINIPREQINSLIFELSKKKIDLMIIGAQKCGTTALHQFLDSHPMFIGSQPKELNYFTFNQYYAKGAKHYHKYFDFKGTKKIYFDASPSDLQDYDSIAAKRIQKYNPEVKLIVLIRDPVERAFSAYNMYYGFWRKNKDWFNVWRDDGLIYEKRTKKDFESFGNYIKHELFAIENKKPIDGPVIKHGIYSNGIVEYLKYFSKEQILIIENKELNGNTYKYLNDILKFMGIKIPHKWEFQNNTKIFKGDYNFSLSNDIKLALNTYYKPYNDKLFDIIGKQYKWGQI